MTIIISIQLVTQQINTHYQYIIYIIKYTIKKRDQLRQPYYNELCVVSFINFFYFYREVIKKKREQQRNL